MLSWISLAAERIQGSPKGQIPPWLECVLTFCKADQLLIAPFIKCSSLLDVKWHFVIKDSGELHKCTKQKLTSGISCLVVAPLKLQQRRRIWPAFSGGLALTSYPEKSGSKPCCAPTQKTGFDLWKRPYPLLAASLAEGTSRHVKGKRGCIYFFNSLSCSHTFP